MQPTCVMMLRGHRAKQTITEKGDGSGRQEVKNRGEEEVANAGWAERVNEWERIRGGESLRVDKGTDRCLKDNCSEKEPRGGVK